MRANTGVTTLIAALLIFITIFTQVIANGQSTKRIKSELIAGTPILWQDPGDIGGRDLYFGPGGIDGGPKLPCRFIKEDLSNTSPKFVMVDSQGVIWNVKIGEEARPETAAVRLLWAIGYFTDETYFMPVLRVEGLRLNRGRGLVGKDLVYNARIEKKPKDKAGHWSWFKNPFLHTKELNGLKVMMALINNWDIKTDNNRIVYDVQNNQIHYLVSDLGESFGRTGAFGRHTTGQHKDFKNSRFIKCHNLKHIDFFISETPTPLLWPVYPIIYPFLKVFLKGKEIVEHIPIEDVRWVTRLLGQLSDRQIADAFRGAGFNAQEVESYTRTMRSRIEILMEITDTNLRLTSEKCSLMQRRRG